MIRYRIGIKIKKIFKYGWEKYVSYIKEIMIMA